MDDQLRCRLDIIQGMQQHKGALAFQMITKSDMYLSIFHRMKFCYKLPFSKKLIKTKK